MKNSLLASSILLALSGQVHAATYKLTELPRHDNSKYTFISDANERGDIIGAASGIYNLPIDVSYIDFEDSTLTSSYDSEKSIFEQRDETITFTLEDIKNGKAATNADANFFMLKYLANRESSPEYQKLLDRIALNISPSVSSEQVLFDENKDDTNGLTRSVSNYLTAVSEDGIKAGWGSSVYSKVTFTPDGETEEKTYFTRSFGFRGILFDNQNVQHILEPQFNSLDGQSSIKGVSSITDITLLDSGHYLAVGQSSIGIPDDRKEEFDEQCDGEDEPVAVCTWTRERTTSFYDLRAFSWELDVDLNVIKTNVLGLGIVPKEDEKFAFKSNALAVNKNNIAVGYSNIRVNDNRLLGDYPGYFKDGKFTLMREPEFTGEQGKATDINNSDIAVGFVNINRNQVGFYYDVNKQEYKEMPYYFKGSSTVANDINDAGYVVGQGVIEKNGIRRAGFIYKIGEELLTNINTLLPCKDSNGEAYPYKISEAIKITENNTIYAIATKTVEKKNSLGQVSKDSNGEVEYETITLPVVLSPITDGKIDDCDPPEAETYERQSGSLSILSIFALPLLWLRRRKPRLS